MPLNIDYGQIIPPFTTLEQPQGFYLIFLLFGPIDLFKVTHPASCWAQMVKEDGELILQVVVALEEMPHLCLELGRVVEGKMKSPDPL